MTHEVEQKFVVDDPVGLEARFGSLGIDFGPPETQVDVYFQKFSTPVSSASESLRLRCESGRRNFITYKGPPLDGGAAKIRREIELQLPPGPAVGAQFEELLLVLGFQIETIVRKRRRTAFVGAERSISVCLDEIDGLGVFVEIEQVVFLGDVSTATQRIDALAVSAGLSHHEQRSYRQLCVERSLAARANAAAYRMQTTGD